MVFNQQKREVEAVKTFSRVLGIVLIFVVVDAQFYMGIKWRRARKYIYTWRGR